ESRLEAAEAAREDATRDNDRHRQVGGQGRRQLAGWEQRARSAEGEAGGGGREEARPPSARGGARGAMAREPHRPQPARRLKEAEERIARDQVEREAWLGRMVSLSRLRETGADDELDLGSFIAELRLELMALRRGEDRKRMTVSERSAAPDAAQLVADV